MMGGTVMASPSNEQLFRTIQEWFDTYYRGEPLEEAELFFYIHGKRKPMRFHVPLRACHASAAREPQATQEQVNGAYSECAADVLAIIRDVGHRLTTNEIFNELAQREKLHGDSTVRTTLARLVREDVLNNKSESRPRGYGLPEMP